MVEKIIDEERVIIEDYDLASKQLLKEKQLRGSPKVLNDHAIIIFWEDTVPAHLFLLQSYLLVYFCHQRKFLED